MRRKFNHADMKEYRITQHQDNMVHVEFPELKASTTEELEAITEDFIKTMTVTKVNGAYIDGV